MISVVVPVYKCSDCLAPLYERLTATLEGLGEAFELVLVDDGSPDDAWTEITALAAQDGRVRGLKLSRNFGQHPAITAGLAAAQGDRIVVMDGDLQHPPEEIPRLLRKAQDGYEIVLGRRRGSRHSAFRKAAAAMYFALLNATLKTDIDPDVSNFSVISRRVRDEFLRIRDADRQYVMVLYWLGFSRALVDYEFAERHAGVSAYSLAGLLRFALAGLFFQTATLLRWIVYAGFAISGGGVLLAIYFVVHYFTSRRPYPGWTSLGVLILLLSGFIIVTTGIAGLYIGKIFAQVKDRPLYLVEAELNTAAKAPGSRIDDD